MYTCARTHARILTHTHIHTHTIAHNLSWGCAQNSFVMFSTSLALRFSFLLLSPPLVHGCHGWDVLPMKLKLEEKRPDEHGQQDTHAVKQALQGEQALMQSNHKDFQLVLCRPSFVFWTTADSCCVVELFGNI